ncbi:MAG: hypothetical protein NC828_04120 [Candidatus Omnitrophica bacterium]|nr:hypothetical protein [Candidatus Omnitrophota bacterium]
MKIEVEYKPISKGDYDTFIRILAKMLADFINEKKTKPEVPNGKERLFPVHPKDHS